jgi:chaperonin GroEL
LASASRYRPGGDTGSRSPLTTSADNAGQDGGIVCERVAERKGNEGYNAATDKYEDLV